MINRVRNIQISSNFVRRFAIAVIIIALVHHFDHVLRYDQSGWPFRADPGVEGTGLVTPFSFSLIVYPILVSLLIVKSRAYRLTASILVAIALIIAHTFIELPAYQYRAWADNMSTHGPLKGHPNTLNAASPLLGIMAVGWSIILNVVAVALPVLIWRQLPMQKNGKKTDSESSFFKDKVIIITGGSSGIGYMAAKLLLAEGARVIVASREGEHLQQAGRTLPGAIIIATDTSNEVSVRAMIEAVYARFARIDILVNNAGRAYGGLLEQLEVEQVDYLFRLHVLGPVASMQAVIPIMRKQGSGRIVNVSSPLAKRTIPGLAAYSLTKAALDRMTLISRKELKDDSIVVSIFYPYITATDIIKKGLDGLKASKDSFDWSHQQTNLPAPDSVKFAASRLVDALQSKKKTSNARSMSYIILGIIKNKLKF